MSRFEEINRFIEHEKKKRMLIEPEKRFDLLKERILKSMDLFSPGIIIKAGLGQGALVTAMAEKADRIFVVEPSLVTIEQFLAEYQGDPLLEKIYFINGNFNNFPVDYYKANMLVCVDYLDFVESGVVIDEFKRALEFEGIFFLGSVVLHDDDLEGIYDDFVRILDPLHNDYYLASDVQTLMRVKEFSSLTGGVDIFKQDLHALIAYWKEYPFISRERTGAEREKQALQYLEEHKEILQNLYEMDEAYAINEHYLTATFRKKQYQKVEPKVE